MGISSINNIVFPLRHHFVSNASCNHDKQQRIVLPALLVSTASTQWRTRATIHDIDVVGSEFASF